MNKLLQPESIDLINQFEECGEKSGDVPVEISTKFLERFSEQLYPSPQKAFEELISNGWDAGASIVDVRISDPLSQPNAVLVVFDNGHSMDSEGIKNLWRIAHSDKEVRDKINNRPLIGKFGVGKLATYTLAQKLTYICKGKDEIIRMVVMDYASKEIGEGDERKSLSNIKLPVHKLKEEDVLRLLNDFPEGMEIRKIIESGEDGYSTESDYEDEYGGDSIDSIKTHKSDKKTWTLAILSDLKDVGRKLKVGVLRRMLSSALPIGDKIRICINGEQIQSSKEDKETIKTWRIGRDDLDITQLTLDDDESENITIKKGKKGLPHIIIEGVGKVTGTIKLYKERISGGTSEGHGRSNGFFVNVRDRVINQKDPLFGGPVLNHSAWACFRMTVRADEIHKNLMVDRDRQSETRAVKILRVFLIKMFNMARNVYESDKQLKLTDGGDILINSIGIISLAPLYRIVSAALEGESVPKIIDMEGIDDIEAKKTAWKENTADKLSKAVKEVSFKKYEPDDIFVKYQVSSNSILINKNHSFYQEHSRSRDEQELLRSVAVVELLSDIYAIDIGVSKDSIEKIREYRNKLMRFQVMKKPKSGKTFSNILDDAQHRSEQHKLMEVIVCKILEFLGFEVDYMGEAGKPEGVAKAYTIPGKANYSVKQDKTPTYIFTFDTKSSAKDKVSTKDLNLDSMPIHRVGHGAQYSLVIAPGFQNGQLTDKCRHNGVTPMEVSDLKRLIDCVTNYGAINLKDFQGVFEKYSPQDVKEWVNDLENSLKENRKLTSKIFIELLTEIEGQAPQTLEASTVAYEYRKTFGMDIDIEDIKALVLGWSVIVPDLVQLDGSRITLTTSARRLAEAIKEEAKKIDVDILNKND